LHLKALIAQLITWYQHTLDTGGYVLVAILMMIESTVLPVPSELVIPFAAQRAHATSKFSVVGIVIAGTIGSWLGATIMYWASRLAGRPFILRFPTAFASFLGTSVELGLARLGVPTRVAQRIGRLFGHGASFLIVTPEKIYKAERWSKRFGSFGVFAARLLPVVRHLIGIPMGIVKMDFKLYSIFTLVGSAIWCSILAWVGLRASQDEHLIKWWVVGFVAGLAIIYYFFVHRHMREIPQTNSSKDTKNS
jgi:membrane protein DedA with SNARE-associated domain